MEANLQGKSRLPKLNDNNNHIKQNNKTDDDYNNSSSSSNMPSPQAAFDTNVSPESARNAAEGALLRVMEFESTTNLPKNPTTILHEFSWSDIKVESLIGAGGFACVCKVRLPTLEDDDIVAFTESSYNGDDDDDDNDDDNNITAHKDDSTCVTSISGHRGDGRPQYFALKCLNQNTVSNEESFVSAACDLASEAMILSRISHPNIIRLFGVSRGCVSQAFRERGGYFMILEHLRGTLSDLLHLWMDDIDAKSIRFASKVPKIPSIPERIQGIALGVARGMEYLHQKHIMYRDLKPQNIGFDKSGNVRLFDFGLAREVNPHYHKQVVKGVAGSYRYMAPECALGEGSYFASDVYSFATVLWGLCTISKPYANMNGVEEFRKKVAIGGTRPSTRNITSPVLKALMKECWNRKPEARPDFSHICNVLEVEATKDNANETITNIKALKMHFKAFKRTIKTQIAQHLN